MTDIAEVGRDGRTYTDWVHDVARDLVFGRREHMPTHADYLRNFVADADGFVSIAQVQNWTTGERVDVRAEIHVEDLDWLAQSWQRVFEVEWKVRQAGPPINPFDPWDSNRRRKQDGDERGD